MVAPTMTTLVRLIPPRWRPRAGFLVLLAASWVAMYGKLWSFESFEEHRFTARAMLTGTLRLSGALSLINGDEQMHDGAGYTNWGFGVPLLQLPFHALASTIPTLHGFFPDRAIYFVYLSVTVAIVWVALERLLARREGSSLSRAETSGLAWAATWLVLARTLFPLMSTRFVVYESTLAYFVLAELLALCAYVFALQSPRWRPAAAMGAAAGLGLLIRPTGLLYLAVWGGFVLLERRPRRLLAFAAAATPFMAFWLYTNWVRTGSIVGLGFDNTNPWFARHTPMERFGSQCLDTPLHAAAATARLFTAFFFFAAKKASVPWLNQCHFDFEERDGVFPFLGPVALGVLGWMIWRLVQRRERSIAPYVPYAAMALLFASFVHRGQGFAWRYAHDFWPLVVLAVVHHVHAEPAPSRRNDMAAGRLMLAYGFFCFAWYLVPWKWTSRAEIKPVSDLAAMERRFLSARWADPDVLANKVSCGDRLPPLFHDGLGWGQDGCVPGADLPPLVQARPPAIGCDLAACAIGTFTNVFVGVPEKATDAYRLILRTEGLDAPGFEVYVNGEIYRALRIGDHYEADVRIRRDAFATRAVMATVKWTDAFEPPHARLLSVELV